jgi:uncharacterized protein YdeI (YjbR/CyaY-like superfamily)
MKKETVENFCPKSRQAWRRWLQKNHSSKQSVWLVHHKKQTGIASVTWDQAVDEALCFGWIDSIRKSVDDKTYIQFFSKRKPTSVWSKINKAKVQRLIDDGLMMDTGYKSIEVAKQNGSWEILNDVEGLIISKDLAKEFKKKPGSKAFFLSLSKSVQKAMLQWIVLAKQQVTRQKRISEIAELAAQKLKPKQFS